MNDIGFSLTAIQAFLVVADTGNFAEAARRLGRTPSAMSKSVARLEDVLGTKLAHRTTRSVSLTADGTELVARLGPLFEALVEEEAAFRESRTQLSGPLRVGLPVAWGRAWFMTLIADFMKTYPAIYMDISLTDRLVDLAEEGMDVVLRAGDLRASPGLIAHRLFDDPLWVCAAPEYLNVHGRPSSPEMLKTHRCVNFRNRATGRLFPWFFKQDGMPMEFRPRGVLVCDDGQSVVHAAVCGLGLSQMPAYLAAPYRADGRLECVLSEWQPDPVRHSLCYLDRRFVSPKVRALVNFLDETLSPTPPWQAEGFTYD